MNGGSMGEGLNITQCTLNNISILDLDGRLALTGNAQFRKRVKDVIADGSRKLIINLKNVPYVDSRGLGELVTCYLSLREKEGEIRLLHPNNRVQVMLATTRLTSVFELFDSESAAISSFVTD